MDNENIVVNEQSEEDKIYDLVMELIKPPKEEKSYEDSEYEDGEEYIIGFVTYVLDGAKIKSAGFDSEFILAQIEEEGFLEEIKSVMGLEDKELELNSKVLDNSDIEITCAYRYNAGEELL